MTDTAAPAEPEQTSPQPGDWVQVWMLVIEGNTHPDDVLVRGESHNEHYKAHVRRDYVEFNPEQQPPGLPLCNHLWLTGDGYLWPCIRYAEHSGQHSSGTGVEWEGEDSHGFLDRLR